MKYTNIRLVPGENYGDSQTEDRYFAIDADTGEEVELLSTKDYYAGQGPEGTSFIAKPLGNWYQGQKGVYNDSGIFKPFEAVDAQGNVIGTWNMAKNDLSDLQKYGGAAIKAAAMYILGQTFLPMLADAAGATDLLGTAQAASTSADAMAIADATQLAAQGLQPAQISQILGQQYAMNPTLAASIAQLGFDNAFAALDASRLAEITTDPNAIQQNLIAAGIDPSIAADLAQQAALGLSPEAMSADLANFYQGSNVYTNSGLLDSGRTLDSFGREIAGISSTSIPGLGNTLQNAGRLLNSLSGTPNVQQQAGMPQGSITGGARGVDYSGLLGLLQNKAGLLPNAEQYRRGLL